MCRFFAIPESKNILDNTGVHPESYAAAKTLLAKDRLHPGGCGQSARAPAEGRGVRAKRAGGSLWHRHSNPTGRSQGAGRQPGRDPRDELPPPLLRTDIMDLSDLKPGMELKGTVRNVIDFGVFVDIGVHQDGLVHISQICDRFIRHPSEVLKVGDIVTVWVLEVDVPKKRISLTMKKDSLKK